MTYREPSRPWGLHSCLPVLGSPSSGGPHSEQHGRRGPGTLPITPCRLAAALKSTYPHSVPRHPCLALGSSTWSPPAPAAASPSGLVSPPGSGGCRPHLTLWPSLQPPRAVCNLRPLSCLWVGQQHPGTQESGSTKRVPPQTAPRLSRCQEVYTFLPIKRNNSSHIYSSKHHTLWLP